MVSQIYQYGKSQTFFVVGNRLIFWIRPDTQFVYVEAYISETDLPSSLTGDSLRRRLREGKISFLERQSENFFERTMPTPETIVGHQFTFSFLGTSTFVITI